MKPRKITFFDSKPYDKEIFEQVNKEFGFETKFLKYHLNNQTVVLAKGIDAVCIFVNDIADNEVVEQLFGLNISLIALRCAGYNNVDIKAAHGKVHVMRVPAYSPHAIAEHAVALMLSLNRKIHRAYFRTRDANFALYGLMGFDMYGKTACVIGTG
jgi:D-lactate dehydrogenase